MTAHWQKQELYKGRDIPPIWGSVWAGWGKFGGTYGSPPTLYYPTAVSANAASTNQMIVTPVFGHEPWGMHFPTIAKPLQNEILARGIPALSMAMGGRSIAPLGTSKNFDMNADPENFRPNGWVANNYRTKDENGNDTKYFRWLHSELMYVAYFYTFKLYEQFVEQGEMK